MSGSLDFQIRFISFKSAQALILRIFSSFSVKDSTDFIDSTEPVCIELYWLNCCVFFFLILKLVSVSVIVSAIVSAVEIIGQPNNVLVVSSIIFDENLSDHKNSESFDVYLIFIFNEHR